MRHILILAFTISSLFIYSQETLLLRYSNSITKDELAEHVYALASDEFEGRYTGSEGQRKAAEYIRREFSEDGLKAPGQASSPPYFQEFTLEKCSWKEQHISTGGTEFIAGEDFLFLSDPVNLDTTFPVIFAGYGIDDPVYSDYKNLDARGKVVLAFSGEPRGKDGNYLISGKSEPSRKAYYFAKSEMAAEKGAAGLIVLAREEKSFRKYARHYNDMISHPEISYPAAEEEGNDIFTVYASLETGAALVNSVPVTFEKMLKEMQDPGADPAKLTGSVDIRAACDCNPLFTENVIGIIEGADKKEEAVVVVAHYDHHGRRDGKLYPGADDNASGTAAVMELAEAFSKAARDGNRPRRTVIFAAVTAEEVGLYGSRHYTENPVIPLDKTYACVNIDMIGRVGSKYKDHPDYIGGYAYVSLDLFTLARQYNALLAPSLKDLMIFRPELRGGSDHYYFASNGIPSLFYFTGIHKDYHEPSDTPGKILYDRMELIVRAIFGTTWALANSEEKLKIAD